MRLCLKLRQGVNPLRPPAPFPSDLILTERVEVVKGSQAAPKAGAPLTTPTRSEDGEDYYEEKGAQSLGGKLPRLPLVGPEEWLKLETGEVCLTNTGLLMEGAESAPG
jgi:hypothetical protein